MRRRPLPLNAHEEMEKSNGKPPRFRLCFLATLSAVFWFLIFYFHFTVLSGNALVPRNFTAHFPSVSSETQHVSTVIEPINPIQAFVPLRSNPSDAHREPKKNNPLIPSIVHHDPHQEPKEKEFPFLRALKTAENKSDPCGGRYIYVYNLPPRFNDDMLKDCKKLSLWTNMCKFTTNAGLGPPLENVEGVGPKAHHSSFDDDQLM